MAYSSVSYEGDGVTTDYNIVFADEPGVNSKPYLKQTHIQVTVDGIAQVISTDYTIDETTTPKVVFEPAAIPASGAAISIRRVTPKDTASQIINFADASMLRAADLNTAQLQNLYISQESFDTFDAPSVSVTEFGADPTGVADSSAAVQAALAEYDSIYFPEGDYIVHGIEIDGDNISINAEDARLINNNSEAMFKVAGNSAVNYLKMSVNEIWGQSAGGHVIDILGSCKYTYLFFQEAQQDKTDAAIINTRGNGSALFSFNFIGGNAWTISASSTVSAIDLTGSAIGIDSNIVSDIAFLGSGVYPVTIEDTSGSSYCISNRLKNLTFITPVGGAVKLVGCAYTDLNSLTLVGLTTVAGGSPLGADGIFVGYDGVSSFGCIGTTLTNVCRKDGELDAVVDINLDAATDTVLINCGSHLTSTGYTIDLNTQDRVFLLGAANATIDNAGTNTVLMPMTGDVHMDKAQVGEEIVLTERADHATTPAAGIGIIWHKDDGTLVFTNPAGTDTVLGSGGGGGGSLNNIVEDLSPELGADLDGGGFNITNVGTVDGVAVASLVPLTVANLRIVIGTLTQAAPAAADLFEYYDDDGTMRKASAQQIVETAHTALGIVPQNRITTTTDPGVNDDGAGTNGTVHIVNDLWTNTTTDKSWICQDITATAAVWAQIDGGGGGGGSTTEKSIEDVIEGLAAATGPAALDEVLLRDVSGTDALIRSTPQQLVETAHTAMGIVPRKTTVTTIDPTASDDSSLGYAQGSWWWNTTLQTLWWARSVGVGAAVWDQVNAGGAGDLWSDVVDAVITPDADGTRDLGLTGTRFATAYVDDLDVTTNIVVGGTVDGRDVAADGTKLDGIATGAEVNAVQASAGEITAATETAERSHSPADIKSYIDQHGASGGGSHTESAGPPLATWDSDNATGDFVAHAVGDTHYDTATQLVYTCEDATATAAVWYAKTRRVPHLFTCITPYTGELLGRPCTGMFTVPGVITEIRYHAGVYMAPDASNYWQYDWNLNNNVGTILATPVDVNNATQHLQYQSYDAGAMTSTLADKTVAVGDIVEWHFIHGAGTPVSHGNVAISCIMYVDTAIV